MSSSLEILDLENDDIADEDSLKGLVFESLLVPSLFLAASCLPVALVVAEVGCFDWAILLALTFEESDGNT